MIVTIKNDEITKEQKIGFYQFVIDVYTLSIDELIKKYESPLDNSIGFSVLKDFGFCNIFSEYFGMYGFSYLLPELYAYKPKGVFYNSYNQKSKFNDQFWFKLDEAGNKKRVNICKKILAELQS